MNNIRMTAILVLACASIAFAVEAQPLDLEFDPLSFSSPSQPGTFRTSVRWGSITVTGHDNPQVLLTARVVPERGRPREAAAIEDLIDLRVNELDNIMDLQIDARIEGFYGIELVILVPRQTRLELEMTNGGEVSVTDVAGDVDVVNRNGSVELVRVGSSAVVDARNGSITASFNEVDPALPMSFSTLNGSIDVTLPFDVAADLRIRHTYGGVESDFPLRAASGEPASADVSQLDRGQTRVLVATINGGGPRYDFHTANGTVYLRSGEASQD